MSLLTYKKRIRPGVKPIGLYEINKKHPFADGLVSYFLLDGSVKDICGGVNVSLTSTKPRAVTVDGELCVESATTVSSKSITITDRKIVDLPLNPFTVIYKGYSLGVYVSSGAIMGWTGADYLVLYPTSGIHNRHRLYWRDVVITGMESDNIMQKGWFTFALVWDGSTIYQYIDGIKQSASFSFDGTGAGPFTDFGLNYWPGGQVYPNSYLSHAIFYDRPLTDRDVHDISKDPYQLLKPVNDPVYFVPDGAAPIFNPAWATNANTLIGGM